MNAEEYQAYLQSEDWQRKRAEALRRAWDRCEVCNGISRLHVHHRTYERVGHEAPEDLTVLCESCHRLFHKGGRIKAAPEPFIQTPWGIVPEQFAGSDHQRRTILNALYDTGKKTHVLVSMTGYDERLVRGSLQILRNEKFVERGPAKYWWITAAGRAHLIGVNAHVDAEETRVT